MEVGKQHNPHGSSEPDVTVHRDTRGYSEMEERKRNKWLEFLKLLGNRCQSWFDSQI